MAKYTILLALLAILLTGCRSVRHIPQETVLTEYRDRLLATRDTLIVRDSVSTHTAGDTVREYRQRTYYKTVYTRDTVALVRAETLRVPYPVETVRTEYRTPTPVRILAWAGASAILAIIIWLAMLIRRRGE